MKTLFKIIGVAFLLFIISLVFIFVAKYKQTSDVVSSSNKEAEAYADRVVPEIVKNWDADRLISEASPELLSISSPDSIKSSFISISSQMGNLKEYKGSEVYKYNLTTRDGASENNVRLKATASFDKANAEFDVWLVSENSTNWKISQFTVKKLAQ